MRVRDAVGAGVAAADHDHVLARRRDHALGSRRARDEAVALVEVVHREVHAVELAARHRQVARHARAGCDDDRVELLAQLARSSRRRRRRRRSETRRPRTASWCSRRSTTLFSILKSGTPKRTSPPPASSRSNTVTECPARASCCAHAIPAGPEPTTATRQPVFCAAGFGCTQPSSHARLMIASSICLIVTDSPSRISSTHAASHGAGHKPPGEVGEVVRAVELLDRLAPLVAVDEVVPVRDQVVDRAAVVAERHAALHAARALVGELARGQRLHELLVVVHALGRRALGPVDAVDLEEAAELAHQAAAGASDSVVTKPWPPLETGWSSA